MLLEPSMPELFPSIDPDLLATATGGKTDQPAPFGAQVLINRPDPEAERVFGGTRPPRSAEVR